MKKRRQRKNKRQKTFTLKIILSAILIIGILAVLMYFFKPAHIYYLKRTTADGTVESLGKYHSLKDAKKNMLKQTDIKQHKNGIIMNGQKKIIAMGYGVVNFRTKKCTINTSYIVDKTNKNGYTNGCYGADGAYIDTSDDGTKIKFKLAGVVGWVSVKDVELKNYYHEKEVASINYYSVKDKKLTHHITTNMKNPQYSSAFTMGTINLKDGIYYSYDGHYFYNTFESMIQDYRKNSYKNSVNTTPYYNYYQYVSHRDKSTYSANDINWYIENYLGFKGTLKQGNTQTSLLYKSGDAFINAQNKYGTNAVMMLSLAINESDFGRSELALTKHNLFGHAAYDASPGASAATYDHADDSIRAHAEYYLQKGYLNPKDQRYHGAFFGDKASGLNVSYASDPYWGEKAASNYRTFDKIMGLHDMNQKTLMTTIPNNNIVVYKEANVKSPTLYTITDRPYTLLVIGKTKDKYKKTWYKVQSLVSLNAQHEVIQDADSYDFQNSYGFVKAKDVEDCWYS